MGKKKGKKGGGKKGKKGGKKSKEPQMTAKEAILGYQIGIIEKKLEDVMYETRGWEEKNKKLTDRNTTLLDEQEVLIKHLLEQAKIADQYFSEEEIKRREDVILCMKDKWDRQRELEREIEGVKKQIASVEEEIRLVQKEVDYCKNYRDVEQHKNKKRINLLEADIEDMEASFQEMKTHLERSNERSKNEISSRTENMLDKQKDLATQKAISKLDKYSQREVLDNEWLTREVNLHRKDTEALREKVEGLEKGNLEIMAELFECKIEDLKISRKFFLTQFEENENLEETGVLEMDLGNLSINDRTASKQMVLYDSGDGDGAVYKPVVRPKSATQRAVEEKVFSLARGMTVESDEDSDNVSDDTELLDNMFFEEEDWNDYLQLGKVELKLLNVTGQQMPIHVPIQPSEAEIQAKQCNPDTWPVTQPMLKQAASS
ncbi:coiled-coil domain-containing protein 83-like [Crassostrea angulata]|uniref:Coiled-coil domain-containing protein 83 n=2 Tax=Magallana gigas TaxID=29159 RepID=A0A8W8JE03_MAGGI|nr:coiled-coil domain-containing protein 83 [Crassostrea gigas]XP_052711811.1 coiled-coil domain-containing protein 83-like [Crassostrea angulata]|eukprot:XP_011414309.1 PREDICTED: coiled-coil domain-containing protein 83 [Crassostrea gigas]